MPDILKGSTDVTRYVMMVDSTTGAPETALTITDIDLQYTRNQAAPAAKVDATALAATNSAHADNKAIAVDATSSPGLYRIDWPDAAFATGVDKVILAVTCTGCAPAVEEVTLVNYNSQDGVRLGLTALPNAAADAAGGLPISDAGGLDLDAQLVTKINDILTDTGTTLQNELDGIQADTEDIQTRLPAALVSGRIDASVGAVANNAITAASINAAAITSAKFAASAIDAAALASDAVTEIQSGLSTLDAAAVNAEVLDVLNTDTFAEPGQEAPGATISLAKKIGYLYKFLRNKITQTETETSVFNDDGSTVGQKATVSDDGTVFTRGEFGTGA